MKDYDALLMRKHIAVPLLGMSHVPELPTSMFPHQAATADFLLRAGRGAAFLDTGLGKTLVELVWCNIVMEHINAPVLMLCPPAVAQQHKREAERFGIEVKIVKCQADVRGPGIYISNYERLHLFDRHAFGAICLDESSIVKSYGGKTSMALMAFATDMKFRLAATATPAPNDHMELGQHCQFLGVMNSNEMLARWFIADQSEMGRYRLKKHGIKDFWSWVAGWARCVGMPSDLGFDDSGYILPPMNIDLHIVNVDMTEGAADGELYRQVDQSATNIHKEKRLTSADRAAYCAELIEAERHEPWMVWVDTDYDARAFLEAFPCAVEVNGKMSVEMKEERLHGFTDGHIKYLISKPSIAGFGLNWQHCARTAFCGLSFSYEKLYQALRRFHRYGQLRQVQAHICIASSEQSTWKTIQRKKAEHETMKIEMFEAMRRECVTREVKVPYRGLLPVNLPNFIRAAQ